MYAAIIKKIIFMMLTLQATLATCYRLLATDYLLQTTGYRLLYLLLLVGGVSIINLPLNRLLDVDPYTVLIFSTHSFA